MNDLPSAPSRFASTAWSVVLGAQGHGPARERALERLAHAYWKPAYYYARRRGLDHHQASDCIQEFFSRMLEGDWLAGVDPARGSFRAWLLTALRRFVARNRTNTGMQRLTVVNDSAVQAYEAEDPRSNPEDLFDRAWAQACMDEAFRRFESMADGGVRSRHIAVFQAFLLAAQEGREPAYADLGLRFLVPVTTITNDLHRARALFKGCLEQAIKDTLGEDADLEKELNAIRQHLSRH